ncbi:MAG: hypothetical protein RL462_1045 [Pseudomonadota bacterium]|jgi:type IV pilus assembly protein PilE
MRECALPLHLLTPESQRKLEQAPLPHASDMRNSIFCNTQGFTLIESLLSVALMTILMGIALPSLEQQWQHTRRQDAHNALGQLHLRQLQWRGLHPQYASTLADLSWPGNTSTAGNYTLTVNTASTQSFELQATAQGLQSRDTACRVMRLQMRADGTVQRTSNSNNKADTGRCWPW